MLGRHRQQHALQRSQPSRTVLRGNETTRGIRPVRPTPMPEIAPGNHQRPRGHSDFHGVRVRSGVACRVFFGRKILIPKHPRELGLRPAVATRQHLGSPVLQRRIIEGPKGRHAEQVMRWRE